MRPLLLLLAALCCALGCRPASNSKGPTPVSEDTVVPPGLALDDVRALLASQGDRAAIVVLQWPGASSMSRSPMSLLRSINPPQLTPAPMVTLLDQLERDRDALEAEGWDVAHPAVLSLSEVPFPGEGIGRFSEVDWAFGQPKGDRIPGVVTRARLPARDVDALMTSLTRALGRAGSPFPGLVEGHARARAWALESGWLALLPGPDHVQVVFEDEAIGGIELERARARLKVLPVEPPQSASVRNLVGTDDGMLVRPGRVADLALWAGLTSGAKVLESISIEQRDMARIKAIEVSSAIELSMVNTPEIEQWSLRGSTTETGELRMYMVADLHARAHREFAAAIERARPGVPVTAERPLLELSMGTALSGSFEPPTALREIASWEQLGELGEAWWNNAVVTQPLGTLAALTEWLQREFLGLPEGMHPRSTQLVVVERSPFRAALAMVMPPELDPSRLRRPGGSVELHVASRGQDQVLLAGVGVDPREVFDAGGELPLEGWTLQSRDSLLDIPSLRGDRNQLELRHIGPALVGELTTRHDGTKPTPSVWPELSALTPRPGPEPSSGEACLRDAARAFHGSLAELFGGTRPSRAVIARHEPALREGLTCALADEAVAARARRMDAVIERSLVLHLRRDLDDAATVERLHAACERTAEPTYCDQARALAAVPHPELVHAQDSCSPWNPTPVLLVRVTPSALAIGERVVEPDRAALQDALMETQTDGTPPFVGLSVDPKVPVARLRPVIQALGALGAPFMVVAIRNDRTGQIRWESVYLDELPDWAEGEGPAVRLRPAPRRRWSEFVPSVVAACGRGVWAVPEPKPSQ